MIMRGAVRHCARCGGRGLFESWFRLRERCPTCGMKFEREEGFWLGGYLINFVLGEAAVVILLGVLIGLLANHVSIPIWPFAVGGVVIAVGGPLATFPYSRTIWSAIDLIMKPLSEQELVQARATIAAAAITEGSTAPAEDDR
jgi:uncharacterized protein (DUF983 family)